MDSSWNTSIPGRREMIYGYIGLDDAIPLEMLTDPSKPTKDEIKDLYRLHNDVQQCRKVLLDGMAKYHPLAVMTFVEGFTEADKLSIEATTGKLSWGHINQRRKDQYVQLRARLTQVDQQIAAQLNNQHQFEVEQRQRAAAAFQQWAYQQQALAQQQQLINAATRPTITNCNYGGGIMTCNSF